VRRSRRFGPRAQAALQRGLTLIELMIGITMSMLIVLALLTLLINVNRNNTEMTRTNSVIENGRFSLQLLEADLSHAGFWGGFVPTFDDLSVNAAVTTNTFTVVAFPTALPDPCAAYPADWTLQYKAGLIAIPIQAYSIPSSGTSPVCASVITAAQPDTDVLVVRHAAPCPASATASDTDCQNTAGNVFFQLSRCATDAAAYALSATATDLVLNTGTCGALAPTYRFVSTIYWIRRYFLADGDGIPTLVRSRFQLVGGVLAHANTDTLIEGIEGFRAELGIDKVSKPLVAGGTGTTLTSASFLDAVNWASSTTLYTPTNRGDGNADSYIVCSDAAVPCSDPFNLANAVAIRIDALVRASSQTPGYTTGRTYRVGGTTMGPFTDGYKRHVFSQTVRLNNVSMRREVPPP
jgi:type IV pilus assembly protein PilW